MGNSLFTKRRKDLFFRMKEVPPKVTKLSKSQQQPVFHEMMLLDNQGLKRFFIQLVFFGKNNEYENVRKMVTRRTGSDSLLKNPFTSQQRYEIKDVEDEYICLAAFEAMFYCFYRDAQTKWSGKKGDYEIFNHKNYIVRYSKKNFQFEKKDDGYISKSDGTIDITYYSPKGSFLITQQEPENLMYILWYSEDMSEELFKLLCSMIEKSNELKEGSIYERLKEEQRCPNKMIDFNRE